MRLIRQVKLLGMTLSEIKSIFDLQYAGTAPCEQVTHMLDDRIVEIDNHPDLMSIAKRFNLTMETFFGQNHYTQP